MELFGRELSLEQMVGLVECNATPDEDLVHRAALEIIAALREGRCVVLPCKVGDTVYMLYPKGILETRITEIFIISKISFSTFNINKHGIPNYHGFTEDDIGKTVFLTRAEAEAALKEG